MRPMAGPGWIGYATAPEDVLVNVTSMGAHPLSAATVNEAPRDWAYKFCVARLPSNEKAINFRKRNWFLSIAWAPG